MEVPTIWCAYGILPYLITRFLLSISNFDITNLPEPVPPPPAVRDFFEFSDFYQQWINVGGLPVLASAEVHPYVVKEAAWIIWQMIGHRRDILKVLARNRKRFTVLALDESFSDTPEYDLYFNYPTKFMGAHAPRYKL